MARINTEGTIVTADSVEFEFGNGIVVKARMQVERHWDETISYEITLITNPGVKIYGMLVYLEHNILVEGQTLYRYTYDLDDDEFYKERLLHDFERDLFDSVMDKEYNKYYS